jgi:hypothetical protein
VPEALSSKLRPIALTFRRPNGKFVLTAAGNAWA